MFFLEVAEVLAVPKSVAAIYGTCFASPAPLCYSEVRERLNISSGSISQGLRVLKDVGALKVVTASVGSREYFTPELEMRKLVARYLEERLEKQLKSGRGRLDKILKSVPLANESSAKVLKGRLKSLQDWHRKASALLPIARTFLKLG